MEPGLDRQPRIENSEEKFSMAYVLLTEQMASVRSDWFIQYVSRISPFSTGIQMCVSVSLQDNKPRQNLKIS